MGATAVRAVLGPSTKVLENRGKFIASAWAPHVMVTVHPSSILRARDHDARESQMKLFIKELKQIARFVS